MAKYSKNDLKKLNKSDKKLFKTSGCRILSDDEMQNISDSMSLLNSDDVKIIKAAQNGNYANFNDASPLVRNYIGTLSWKKFISAKNVFSSSLSLSNEQVKKYVQDHVLDAGFRVGLSAMRHASPDNNDLKKLDEYANEYMLTQTLSIPSAEKVEALSASIGANATQKELEKSWAKQVVLAKTLFLAQLGKYTLSEGDKTTDYVGSIAETFAHGGRTNFILPLNDVNNEVIAAFDGGEIGKTAELKSRIAATHSATQRKVSADLSIESESIEEKPKFSQVGKIFSNQYGMNIAIGGVGNIGPNQKPILADGSAGHVYIRKQQGGINTCGSLLIGIESAASLKTSHTGHFHTPLAKSSKQSAFLADKFGPGNKTAGKTVDLSGLDSKQLALALKVFEKSYINLQKAQDTNKLNKVNELLSGQRMSETNFIMMTDLLGIQKDFARGIFADARKGLTATVQREVNNLAVQFKNVLGLDLKGASTAESVKVMQKTEDNKWILTNLFFENDTYEQRFSKFWKSVQSGKQLYLTSNLKVNPTKININQKEISLGKSIDKADLVAPKEPSRFKKALHRLSGGLLFHSAIIQYKEQKEANEQQAVLNSYIDKHKVVVGQTKRDLRAKEDQSALREMLVQSLKSPKELEKAPQIKDSVSKEEITFEL